MNMLEAVKKAVLEGEIPYRTGIEREGLRITPTGWLAETPHPAVFGEKLKNYHIKTDFCESQPELVTSPHVGTEETYAELCRLTEILKKELEKRGELLWPQSMPCLLPPEERILTAVHPGDFAAPLREYLEMVRKKYGARVQSISGIHYNFSFTEEFWQRLWKLVCPQKSLRAFRDDLYLKILRNYLRHSWFVLLLTGCSPAVHESFGAAPFGLTYDNRGFQSGDKALSLRSSSIGYHNPQPVAMDYSSVETLCSSLEQAVERGELIDQGELFAPIKAKAKDSVQVVSSLRSQGIQYLELRNIDLNIFEPVGIARSDMEFLPLLLVYFLILPESKDKSWQREARENELAAAQYGRDMALGLLRSGQSIALLKWLEEITADLKQLNQQLGLCRTSVLEDTIFRILNPDFGYAARACRAVRDFGYVRGNLNPDAKK